MAERRTSLFALLARVVALVSLIPFLPLAWVAWSSYHGELDGLEEEIQASNRHIALIASSYVESLLAETRQEAVRAVAGGALPVTPRGVVWELVSAEGTVIESQLDPARRGGDCGYHRLLADLGGHTPVLSEVGTWVLGHPPTVLCLRRLADDGRVIVAVLDPEALHRDLHALSSGGLERHVYAVDGFGSLLFYSDLSLSGRGADLRPNPPIELFLAGGAGAIRYHSVVSGRERLGVVERLEQDGWGVIVSADAGSRLIQLRTRYLGLGWAIAFALTAALLIVLWTSRRLARPVLDIGRAMRSPQRQPHASLEVDPSTRSIREYAELVAVVDELSGELVEVERELVQAEKASLLGQLASGLAHEMGTPLNVITGNAQYLLRKTGEDHPSRPILKQIVGQAERITSMIRRLLDLSRPAAAELVPLDLEALVEHTLGILPAMGGEVVFEVAVDPATPPVLADPKLLEHALLNLIVNACQAMPHGGRVTIEAGAGGGRSGQPSTVVVRVRDTGVGIAAGDLERVFEPFFTTKAPDQGTGLGLAIVDRIVRQHGGRISVESSPGAGTVFSVHLRPAPEGAATATGTTAGRSHE